MIVHIISGSKNSEGDNLAADDTEAKQLHAVLWTNLCKIKV